MSDAVEPVELPVVAAVVQFGDAAIFDEAKFWCVHGGNHLPQQFSFKLRVNDHDDRLVGIAERVADSFDNRTGSRSMLCFGFAFFADPPSIGVDGGIGNAVTVGKEADNVLVSQSGTALRRIRTVSAKTSALFEHVVPNLQRPLGCIGNESHRLQRSLERAGDQMIERQTFHPLGKMVRLQTANRGNRRIFDAFVGRPGIVLAFGMSDQV